MYLTFALRDLNFIMCARDVLQVLGALLVP